MPKNTKYYLLALFFFCFAGGMLFSILFWPDPEIVEVEVEMSCPAIEEMRADETRKAKLCTNRGGVPFREPFGGELEKCIFPPSDLY